MGVADFMVPLGLLAVSALTFSILGYQCGVHKEFIATLAAQRRLITLARDTPKPVAVPPPAVPLIEANHPFIAIVNAQGRWVPMQHEPMPPVVGGDGNFVYFSAITRLAHVGQLEAMTAYARERAYWDNAFKGHLTPGVQ